MTFMCIYRPIYRPLMGITAPNNKVHASRQNLQKKSESFLALKFYVQVADCINQLQCFSLLYIHTSLVI